MRVLGGNIGTNDDGRRPVGRKLSDVVSSVKYFQPHARSEQRSHVPTYILSSKRSLHEHHERGEVMTASR